jgi:predicted metal-dependent enzyme (double-stranded beta helix superfamily)
LGFGTTLLHVEADQSLFVVVDSWLPGRGVRPHDHDTWAVVVGVEGEERNLFWRRLDDASRPGHAELECCGEQRIGAGEVLLMPSGGIHSVINEGQSTSLSFHVYGRHLNHTRRRQFDPELKLELPFVIDPR